jgi:hypothetical protein
MTKDAFAAYIHMQQHGRKSQHQPHDNDVLEWDRVRQRNVLERWHAFEWICGLPDRPSDIQPILPSALVQRPTLQRHDRIQEKGMMTLYMSMYIYICLCTE